MNEQIFTIKEVADQLNMSPETVRRMILEGQFPNARKLRPEKETSPYRIPRSDVTAYQQRVDRFQVVGRVVAVQQVEGQTQD